MQIILMENDKEKVYVSNFISGIAFRNAIQLQKKAQGEALSVELLDDLVAFVVDVFNGQFTVEQFYNGVEASKLLTTLLSIISTCVSGEQEKH